MSIERPATASAEPAVVTGCNPGTYVVMSKMSSSFGLCIACSKYFSHSCAHGRPYMSGTSYPITCLGATAVAWPFHRHDGGDALDVLVGIAAADRKFKPSPQAILFRVSSPMWAAPKTQVRLHSALPTKPRDHNLGGTTAIDGHDRSGNPCQAPSRGQCFKQPGANPVGASEYRP